MANIDETDSLAMLVARTAEKTKNYSILVDSINASLNKEVKRLWYQNDTLKKKSAQKKVILASAKNSRDSISTLMGEVIYLELQVANHQSTEYIQEQIITNLTNNRDSLQNVLDSVPAKMEAIRKLNTGVRKEVEKISGEPFVDFDWGVGASAMPDLREPLNFKKWRVGPSINATVSLHP